MIKYVAFPHESDHCNMCDPRVSLPPPLRSSFHFWLLCLSLWESRNAFCGANEQNKNSLIVAQKFTHGTLAENAKTSGPTEQQQREQKKDLCETSELSGRRGAYRREKAFKLNLLVFHSQTLYTLLYMLTQQIPSDITFFALLVKKKHILMYIYKKVFPFCKRAMFLLWRCASSDAQRCGYAYNIYIYNRRKVCISLVYTYHKKTSTSGSILLWNTLKVL